MSKEFASEQLGTRATELGLDRSDEAKRTFALPLSQREQRIKRATDLVVGSLLFLFVLPLMLLIALLVRLDSRGPVLFRQERVGLNGKLFVMFKFRTLFAEQCDPDGRLQASLNDPHVTTVGHWLRRTSIDELPQLVNVVMGDMSLVGPRPHAPATEVEGRPFADALPEYDKRHCVKPGLTGWAQVHGWRGPTPTLKSLQYRLEYDLDYIENWSLGLDLVILVRTLGVPFATGLTGAHEELQPQVKGKFTSSSSARPDSQGQERQARS